MAKMYTLAITLGDTVTDSITGLTGVVTGKTEYLQGCVQFLVQPRKLKDGLPVKAQWLDEGRLTETSQAKAGGPQPTPPERSHPE